VSRSLADIRDSLEGGAPAVIATCAADGTPNVSYLSDVQMVDERHVALSFQFFIKTRANVLANPFARILLVHGTTAQRHRLLAQYLRTETEGPLFERMRARLAGIASHQGMAGVFKLRGADVYRVLTIDAVPAAMLPPPPRANVLPALRAAMARVVRAAETEALIDELLDAVVDGFAVPHAMLRVHDPPSQRLVAVASRGYATSGIGAEVAENDGVIGVAAAMRVPIRISHALAEHAYVRVVRSQITQDDGAAALETPIPLPGLAAPGSQLALPISDGTGVVAVLFIEHPRAQRFGDDLEDALSTLTEAAGAAWKRLEQLAASEGGGAPALAPPCAPSDAGSGPPLRVHREPRTNSVFVDGEYVIRGVAGAVLWKMLCAHAAEGRTEFSSRELRADASLNLPEITDNLAARLILLQRRLAERPCGLRLHKCGRGRVALEVQRPLALAEAPG
jgi:adenylate cyclase